MGLDYEVFFFAVFLLLSFGIAEKEKDIEVESLESFQKDASACSRMDDGFMVMDEAANPQKKVQHVYNCGLNDSCVNAYFYEFGVYYRFTVAPCGRCIEGLKCIYTILDVPQCAAIYQCVPTEGSHATDPYISVKDLPGQAALLEHDLSHCRPSWIPASNTTESNETISQDPMFWFGRGSEPETTPVT